MNNYSNLPYFIFNNKKSSDDLGIIIKELPPISKSEKDIDILTINGRNGDLHIDNGTYRSKKYKITCILMDESKIDTLKATLDGIGILEISTEPNKEFKAVIKNQIDFSKYLKHLKEFVINFELYPIGYSKTYKTTTYTQSNTFTVDGTFNVSPLLTITGTGTITLNNVQVQVLETGITIDCDLMNCVKGNVNKNDKVILDEFPTLKVGTNTLTLGTGIESVEVKYKEGWL